MSFWVAGAVVVGSVVNSMSASDAVDAQSASTQAGLDENRREFDRVQENQKPWLEAGTRALGQLETGVNTPLDPNSVQMDPGYQFGLKQGQQAIDRKTAAAGGRISGAALKAAAQYGSDYGTTHYESAYNRANQARSDRLNRLAALAGLGQTATQQVNSAGLSVAGSNADMLTAQGNATAAGRMAQGNIWGNTGNQLASLYGRSSGGAGLSGAQAAFSNTSLGSSGFGTGLAYGNQDMGAYL